ncbi:MAG: ATP-binding protein [Candidatus Tectimicrobiota bacterium]
MASLTLPACMESLTQGLAFVSDCAVAVGFPATRVVEIELAVEEALANICQYAYPESPGEVELHCEHAEGQQFYIQLVDTGVPFDILTLPSPDLTVGLEERQIGGLGIPLILAMVDHVAYYREGSRNILQLAVRVPLEQRDG